MDEIKRIYLAAPLFSQVERIWNRRVAEVLKVELPGTDVVLPQDFRVKGRYNDSEYFPDLYRRCVHMLESSTAVIAMLDGADVDSGVAFEIGLARGRGIPVVGVRTDYRSGQDKGVNLMISNGCSIVVREYSFGEDPELMVKSAVRALLKVLKSR